jgi:hypothetical protein
MATATPRLAHLIQQGVLLFSQVVPFPASTLVAAVSAAAISKMVELHKEHVAEILNMQLLPDHIAFVEPSDSELLDFFRTNRLFPKLAMEFEAEIENRDMARLRHIYPYLYNCLILKKQVPLLLFHEQIEKAQYRNLAATYEALSRGYAEIHGDVRVQDEMNQFGADLLAVLSEIYGASEKELRSPDNKLIFEIIDYIREVAEA